MPLTTSFTGELQAFAHKLAAREPFALTRFADGEQMALQGSGKLRGGNIDRERGFHYEPGNPVHEAARSRLRAALTYQSVQHYVGIGCPCCVGGKNAAYMREQSGQPADHLTWANIWVNANYPTFRDQVLPLFGRYGNRLLVAHADAAAWRLPFQIDLTVGVGGDAWLDCDNSLALMAEWLDVHPPALVLCCAGPASNILIAELHPRFPQSTFLNLGSALDPLLFPERGITRSYQQPGTRYAGSVCRWD